MPPRCAQRCRVPRLCRHAAVLPDHRCHFGPCPPCPKRCGSKQVLPCPLHAHHHSSWPTYVPLKTLWAVYDALENMQPRCSGKARCLKAAMVSAHTQSAVYYRYLIVLCRHAAMYAAVKAAMTRRRPPCLPLRRQRRRCLICWHQCGAQRQRQMPCRKLLRWAAKVLSISDICNIVLRWSICLPGANCLKQV